MLSLTNAKSGALVGVLISVTTIPRPPTSASPRPTTDWDEMVGGDGAARVNLAAIVLAGIVTLFIQRKLYMRRRRAHLHDEAREARRPAGGPQPHQKTSKEESRRCPNRLTQS